jgi:hypothetical protein
MLLSGSLNGMGWIDTVDGRARRDSEDPQPETFFQGPRRV